MKNKAKTSENNKVLIGALLIVILLFLISLVYFARTVAEKDFNEKSSLLTGKFITEFSKSFFKSFTTGNAPYGKALPPPENFSEPPPKPDKKQEQNLEAIKEKSEEQADFSDPCILIQNQKIASIISACYDLKIQETRVIVERSANSSIITHLLFYLENSQSEQLWMVGDQCTRAELLSRNSQKTYVLQTKQFIPEKVILAIDKCPIDSKLVERC